jgi:hypothetical protein
MTTDDGSCNCPCCGGTGRGQDDRKDVVTVQAQDPQRPEGKGGSLTKYDGITISFGSQKKGRPEDIKLNV